MIGATCRAHGPTSSTRPSATDPRYRLLHRLEFRARIDAELFGQDRARCLKAGERVRLTSRAIQSQTHAP